MAPQLTRRRLLVVSGQAAAGTALLAACGEGLGASGDVALWQSFDREEDQRFFEQHFVDAFNSSHEFDVSLTVKPQESLERLQQTAVASGRGPDIVFTSGPSYVLSYANAGRLLSLNSFAQKHNWNGRLYEWASVLGRVDDKLYALPADYETMLNFYNPQTFSKYGWNPPRTKDDFESICADAHDRGIMPVAAGNAEWKAANEWYVTIVWNHHAGPEALYQALTGEIPWTDAVFVDAIELLRSYFQKGWFGGGTQAYFTNKFTDLYSKLANGQAAMCPTGSWATLELGPFFARQSDGQEPWDWAVLPRLSDHAAGDVYEIGVGSTYSINKDSQSPDHAATYLDFFLFNLGKQMKQLATIKGQLPPVQLNQADFPPAVDPRLKRLYLALDHARTVGYTTWTFWPPKSDVYIYEQFEKVITGEMSAKEYCTGLDEVFRQELRAGKVPTLPKPHFRS